MKQAKIRLFVEQPLGQGQTLNLNADQAHYLFGVMRRSVDDVLLVFNGKDGEWLAKVEMAGKRKGVLVCQTQTRPTTISSSTESNVCNLGPIISSTRRWSSKRS